MRTMSPGAAGEDVRDVQQRLAALGFRVDPDVAGVFGPGTAAAVRAFQQGRNLLVDGRVGPVTWQELVEAGYALGDRVLYLRYPYVRGDDVRDLQTRLNRLGFDSGREDGIFGEGTDRGVREFQRNVGLPTDGIVGATTLEALGRLRPTSTPGPGRAEVREREDLMKQSGSLAGATVALSASLGAGEPGPLGPTGLTAAEASFELAEAAAAALRDRGARVVLLRERDSNPPVPDRARAANASEAEVLVDIGVNAHSDPQAEGATTFFYGRDSWRSVAGQHLAELIQGELVELGLKDGHAHPKWLPLLRETRMPAVHVEPCFLTNPEEEAALRRPDFRRALARAITVGIERFLGAADAATSAP